MNDRCSLFTPFPSSLKRLKKKRRKGEDLGVGKEN